METALSELDAVRQARGGDAAAYAVLVAAYQEVAGAKAQALEVRRR